MFFFSIFFLFYFFVVFFFTSITTHQRSIRIRRINEWKWRGGFNKNRRRRERKNLQSNNAPTVIPPRLNLHLLICTTLSYGVLDISVQNVDRMCVWSVFVFTCGVKTNVIKLETVCVTALLYVQCSCPSFEKIEWNSLHKNHNK